MTAATLLSRDGILDMVAVARWVEGDTGVVLTEAETRVAVWVAVDAGLSAASITERLACRHSKVKTILSGPRPVDHMNQPIHL